MLITSIASVIRVLHGSVTLVDYNSIAVERIYFHRINGKNLYTNLAVQKLVTNNSNAQRAVWSKCRSNLYPLKSLTFGYIVIDFY